MHSRLRIARWRGHSGITPATAWVEVGDETVEARFGHWRVSAPLANIADIAVTGPYAFWKMAGPARLAITDRGLTFPLRMATVAC